MKTAAQVYAMLGNETLWETARQCHATLQQGAFAHAVVGGVAVCLHGYQRNTVDLDVLVRRDDAGGIRRAMEQSGYRWLAEANEFRSSSGIAIQLLMAGD